MLVVRFSTSIHKDCIMKTPVICALILVSASAASSPLYVNQADFNEIIDFTLVADFCQYAAPELGMKSKRDLAERMRMVDPQTARVSKVKEGLLDADSKNNKAKFEANPEKGKALCLMMVGPMKQFNAKYGVE